MHEPESSKRIVFSRAIPAMLRIEALAHNGFTCHMCGLAAGEIDSATGRTARLHIGHIIDKKSGGEDKFSNLRAVCSICRLGRKNLTTERPTGPWLVSQVGGAGTDDQLAVLKWLGEKFKDR